MASKREEQLRSEIRQLQHDLAAITDGIRLIVDSPHSRLFSNNPVIYYALHFWIGWGQRSVDGSKTRVPQ